MKVIICGAGKVGTSIARHLVSQNNDVTVIDQSANLINNLKEKVDLKTINGSASNPSILKKAGAEETAAYVDTLRQRISAVRTKDTAIKTFAKEEKEREKLELFMKS